MRTWQPNLFPWHSGLRRWCVSPSQVWPQKVQQFRRYRPHKHWLQFWTFVVTVTLNTTIQYCRWTLWLFIIYQVSSNQVWLQKNEYFKRYSRSSHILITLWSQCDLDLEDSIPTFSHDTLARDELPPYHMDRQCDPPPPPTTTLLWRVYKKGELNGLGRLHMAMEAGHCLSRKW